MGGGFGSVAGPAAQLRALLLEWQGNGDCNGTYVGDFVVIFGVGVKSGAKSCLARFAPRILGRSLSHVWPGDLAAVGLLVVVLSGVLLRSLALTLVLTLGSALALVSL